MKNPQAGNSEVGHAAITYLRSAPRALIAIHQSGGFPQRLTRLLTDPRMKRAWRELGKVVKDDAGWRALVMSVQWCGDEIDDLPERKSVIRQRFRTLASRSRAFARCLETTWPGITVSELVPGRRRVSLFANRTPTVVALLRSLADEADTFSRNVMREHRLVQRVRKTTKRTTITAVDKAYVRALVQEFRSRYGQPMYGTAAAIANVMLLRQDEYIDKKFVQDVARGVKGTP